MYRAKLHADKSLHFVSARRGRNCEDWSRLELKIELRCRWTGTGRDRAERREAPSLESAFSIALTAVLNYMGYESDSECVVVRLVVSNFTGFPLREHREQGSWWDKALDVDQSALSVRVTTFKSFTPTIQLVARGVPRDFGTHVVRAVSALSSSRMSIWPRARKRLPFEWPLVTGYISLKEH